MPFYQPKVRLADGRLVGIEVLARWRHPSRGIVMPEEFLPVAEEVGLGPVMGELILREAVAQARAWQAAGLARRAAWRSTCPPRSSGAAAWRGPCARSWRRRASRPRA